MMGWSLWRWSSSFPPGSEFVMPVTNEVVFGNYRFNVTLSPGTPLAYYRLHKPEN